LDSITQKEKDIVREVGEGDAKRRGGFHRDDQRVLLLAMKGREGGIVRQGNSDISTGGWRGWEKDLRGGGYYSIRKLNTSCNEGGDPGPRGFPYCFAIICGKR